MGVTAALRPVEQSGRDKRVPEPCIFVVFGASGDVTKRELLPALFHLRQAGLLPEEFAVVAVARRDLSRHVLGREHAAGQQQQHDAEGLRHCSYYWHAMHGVTHFDGPYIASSALHFLSSFPKDLKQISD